MTWNLSATTSADGLCHGSADEVLSNPDAKKYYFGESPGVEAA